MNNLNLLIYLFVLLLNCNCYALDLNKDNLLHQRNLYLEIEKNINKNHFTLFMENKKKIINYPLYPYLEYQYMSKNINNITPEKLTTFLTEHPTFPLNDKLKNSWLKNQFEHKKWENYITISERFYTTKNCDYINAKIYLSNNKISNSELANLVIPIWLQGTSQSKSCDPLFSKLEEKKLITTSLIWERISLAIQNNNLRLARFLAKKLNKEEKSIAELWVNTVHNPNFINKTLFFQKKHPAIPKMIVMAIKKISAKNPNIGISLWNTIKKQHPFTEKQYAEINSNIAINLSHKSDPKAIEWFKKIPKKYMDLTSYNILLKLYLTINNWEEILRLTSNVPNNIELKEKWTYWQARALEELNLKQDSNFVLESIAKRRSYYGFLASEKLQKPFHLTNKKIHPVTNAEINSLLENKTMARIQELLALNKNSQAEVEWQNAISNFSEHEKQIAAHLARNWKKPYWAITALNTAKNKENLRLRFPTIYGKTIFDEANRNKLDPSWIYAITRQESAFAIDAKSKAGALGLMQVMPDSAKYIATTKKIKYNSFNDLLKIDNNIKLGSSYLSMLLSQNNNNFVLATASYNAGPSKVKQWLPRKNIPADIWIDTIPYLETRNYVQNVITYTIIYNNRLGKTLNLKKIMPIIEKTS